MFFFIIPFKQSCVEIFDQKKRLKSFILYFFKNNLHVQRFVEFGCK